MAQDGLVEVSVEGFGELIGNIQSLGDTLASEDGRNELVTEIGAALLARIRRRFLEETDPDGTKWPISKRAAIRKAGGETFRLVNGVRKGYKGGGILFETGALFQSIQLGKADGGEINIGTDVPYARPLQEGTDRLPKRVFLGFGNDDRKFAEDRLEKAIEKRLKELTKGT